jgi:hypothetical protein
MYIIEREREIQKYAINDGEFRPRLYEFQLEFQMRDSISHWIGWTTTTGAVHNTLQTHAQSRMVVTKSGERNRAQQEAWEMSDRGCGGCGQRHFGELSMPLAFSLTLVPLAPLAPLPLSLLLLCFSSSNAPQQPGGEHVGETFQPVTPPPPPPLPPPHNGIVTPPPTSSTTEL